MEPAPRWSEFPADALGEIAGHLRDATDFVRFHPACRPWRDAAPPHTPSLLPWLYDWKDRARSRKMHFRSPLSRRSVSVDTIPVPRPPLFHRQRSTSFGSLNGIFHSSLSITHFNETVCKLLGAGRGVSPADIPKVTEGTMADLKRQPGRTWHVLEFQGEVLCVEVVDILPWVSVRALQVGDDGIPRWVTRDTDHLCLFLGSACYGSLAIDVGDFAGTGMTGGCAYLISRRAPGKKGFAVFRYSFKDGRATIVDELPLRFDKKSQWLMPRPRLSAVRAQIRA